jgi:hypothetical protein
MLIRAATSELTSRDANVQSRREEALRNFRIIKQGKANKTPRIKTSLGCCPRKLVGSARSFLPLSRVWVLIKM